MGRLHLKCLKSNPDIEVVGVYDLNPRMVIAVAHEFGVPPIDNLESLLFEADAVIVAASTCSHYSVTEKALEAGLHVLVEKPAGGSSERASKLFALAKKSERVLKVGFLERVRLSTLPKELFPRSIEKIHCHRLSLSEGRDRSVDIIADLMIHDLDLVATLFRRDPLEIKSVGYGGAELKAAHAHLDFGSDVFVKIAASYQAPAVSRMMMIEGDGQKLVLNFQTGDYLDIRSGSHGVLTSDPLSIQHREFVLSIRQLTLAESSDENRSLIWADKVRENLLQTETNPSLALGLSSLHDTKTGLSDAFFQG